MAAIIPMMQAQQKQQTATQFQQQQPQSTQSAGGNELFSALVKHFASGPDSIADDEAHAIFSSTVSAPGGHAYLTALLGQGERDCKERKWNYNKTVGSGTAQTTTGLFKFDFSVPEDALQGSGEMKGVFTPSLVQLGGAEFMYDDLGQILASPCSFRAEVVKINNNAPYLTIDIIQNGETIAVVQVSNSYVRLPPYVGGGAKISQQT